MTSGEGILSSTGFPTPLLITPSGKAAPRRPDPGIRRRIQIGTLRPIRVDHTKCLQVAIKTHSFMRFIRFRVEGSDPESGTEKHSLNLE